MAKKAKTYEQLIERLSEIIDLMENSDTPLQKSIELYQEGIELSQEIKAILDKAEAAVSIIYDKSDKLEEFDKNVFGEEE